MIRILFSGFATSLPPVLQLRLRSPRPYAPEAAPLPRDYSQDKYWAALPWRQDEYRPHPRQYLTDRQAEAVVDVFFLHPTTYTGRRATPTGTTGAESGSEQPYPGKPH